MLRLLCMNDGWDSKFDKPNVYTDEQQYITAVTFAASWGLRYISGREWVVSALHGVVSTAVAARALVKQDARAGYNAITLTRSYFAYDLLQDLVLGTRDPAFFAHHIISLAASTVVLQGGPSWFPYTWLQTNECSTPFLYLGKELGYQWAKKVFALLFLLSRVAVNGFVIHKFCATNLAKKGTDKDTRRERFLMGCSVCYYAVQLLWFAKIVQWAVNPPRAKV